MAFHDLLFAAHIPASLDAFNTGADRRTWWAVTERPPIEDSFSRLASRLVRLQARARRAARTWLRILRVGY